MGICASKCFPSPTASMSDPESPREIDKLVLPPSLTLTTPPPPKNPFSENTKNFSKFQIHPSPSSSSSSSSSNPSTSMMTSSTASYSYSSTYSTNTSSQFQTPKKKPFSNEFLLACAKENSNKIILDPTKNTNEKEKSDIPRPVTPRGLTSSYSSSSLSSLRHRTNLNISMSMKIDQSVQAKGARSVSPASRTGRKSIRSETGPIRPTNLIHPNSTTRLRMGTPPLPQRRPISSRKGVVNVIKRDSTVPLIEKQVDSVQSSEDTQMGEIEEDEVISRERIRTPPPLVEDLNNPLIAMDCFIFL